MQADTMTITLGRRGLSRCLTVSERLPLKLDVFFFEVQKSYGHVPIVANVVYATSCDWTLYRQRVLDLDKVGWRLFTYKKLNVHWKNPINKVFSCHHSTVTAAWRAPSDIA